MLQVDYPLFIPSSESLLGMLGRELGETEASLGGVSMQEMAEPWRGGRRGIYTASLGLAVKSSQRHGRVTRPRGWVTRRHLVPNRVTLPQWAVHPPTCRTKMGHHDTGSGSPANMFVSALCSSWVVRSLLEHL
jgi:hypothetical protein